MLRQLTGAVRHIDNEVVCHKKDHLLDKLIFPLLPFPHRKKATHWGRLFLEVVEFWNCHSTQSWNTETANHYRNENGIMAESKLWDPTLIFRGILL